MDGVNSLCQQFIHMIRFKIPFIYVKMGDGELSCMRLDEGQTCDGQKYSPEMAKELLDAYTYLAARGAYINRWGVNMQEDVEMMEKIFGYKLWVDGKFMLHRNDNDTSETVKFWKTVINDPRQKFFIGPLHLFFGMKNDFKFNGIMVTKNDDAYDDVEVSEDMISVLDDDAIIITSCGPAAKIILSKLKPTQTGIDAGSSFDPLYGKISRTGQTLMNFNDLYGNS